MADPLLGRTVAQYEIVARLGGGGMGVVYKARDRKLDRDVALKFLPQQWSHDEGAKQRFVREAQAASATHHPNICIVHDIGTADDGQLFIVMGYYDGPTLKQRLEAGPLAIDEALDVATQVADGLAKAHAQGVVHRDIKPGNLILTEDGVRIVDFGLATFVDALQLTTEGSTIGTAAYMSPEQVRGEEVDARTDVWALGVVLYEMLTGHVPFRGSYAEAIAYAIRHDPPPPIRAERPEVPEDVEQLVFRAMHKDPAIRFGSARELARALRQVRGLTVPQDLRTIPVDARAAQTAAQAVRPRRSRRPWLVAAGVAVLVMAAIAAWLSMPVPRVPIAIAPVSNQTGDPALDAYRMALTLEVIGQLADSRGIRVLPYERLQEIVQQFRGSGRDISSRNALQAVATYGGADLLLLPALVYDDSNRQWRARIEIRTQEGDARATLETDAVESSLAKDTAYRLSVALAARVRDHFRETGPWRARVGEWVRAVFGGGAAPAVSRLRTLDAAAAFERGLQWYEQTEYAAARDAFAAAAELDARDPLSLAWRSRLAILMRQDRQAVETAERAVDVMRDDIGADDRLFVEAVVEEARRNAEGAESKYRELASRHGDNVPGVLELAGFLDRQGRTEEAVEAYQRALAQDSQMPRTHVELCRLYSPGRREEPVLARKHGETALTMYRDLDHRSGQAQALWCLADVLRNGNDADRRDAARHADEALAIMKALGYPYGLARGFNYVGQVALSARDGSRAASFFEQTLEAARAVDNVLLESRTLMNLGVAYDIAGMRATALKYYRQGYDVFEASGSQQDAAWTQANAAAILVDYGGAPDDGLRDARNALAVFQKIGDKRFEVFARRIIASHRRYVGDHAGALAELSIALNVARERNLATNVVQLSIELARLHFDQGDYVRGRELLDQIEGGASGTDAVHVHIERGRTLTRLGSFAAAAADLMRAAQEIDAIRDVGSLPLLHAAQGELAYESGRDAEAQALFRRAAAAWVDDLPEAASVEARAYAGWLDAAQGRIGPARQAVAGSLAQAQKMRRLDLEARCRLLLARLEMNAGRPAEALDALGGITAERQQALAPELRAQLHFWRSRALARSGNGARAGEEAAAARKALDEVRKLIPEPDVSAVLSRPDIRFLNQP
jgi:tetratricopeptide (TPR) repeat protein/tRNA A-37 threonylcarbamoyl transferase component Bud32